MTSVINFDENVNLLQRVMFKQDFREVHSSCWVVFSLPAKTDFAEGFGFTYLGHEWEAVSYKRVDRGGEYFYSVLGYPKAVCSIVDKKYTSLRSLAIGMGIAFDKDSTDFEFEFPLRNVVLAPLLYKYRYGSMEKSANNLGSSWYIFYDNRGLVGNMYSSLARSSVVDFDTNMAVFLGGNYSFIRDYQNMVYHLDSLPSKVSYKNWVNTFVGDKFDFKTALPGQIGRRYKLSGTDEELFSKYDKLILVRQKFDSSKKPLSWTLTFGQLLVGG